jgi:two-component system NtrC family sensor kinase
MSPRLPAVDRPGERSPALPDRRPLLAELAGAGWDLFSSLLFVSAVLPEVAATGWVTVIFLASIAVSAAIGPALTARGPRGYDLAALLRVVSWPLAVAPVVETSGRRVLVAALVFGLMAAAMRRALYRVILEPRLDEMSDTALAVSLRARLAESAMMAGIAGGHAMLLFTVAFLRTRSQINLETWFFIVPVLALPATLGFTLVVRRATSVVVQALAEGAGGDPALLVRGLSQARALPNRLAWLNFVTWLICTSVGVLRMRPGPVSWSAGDAILQLSFAALFSWGVAFYQRGLHRDHVGPAVERLRRWTGADPLADPIPLGRRMLRDFGLPLLFTCLMSLLSSIGLYRALGAALTAREDFNAVSALIAAFTVLVLAVGGMVARAARDLSRPLSQLAQAADRVARGELDAAVPRVSGPTEVVTLGESLERMRVNLVGNIAELEEKKAGLEANVAARTAELTHTLEELKRTQATLIHGERLASIGELVAGVAHEINNPLNAIAGAAVPLAELAPELREVLDAYRAAEADLPPARREALVKLRTRLDLDASLDDLGGISTVIRRAVDRSVKIVQNLRSFSRASGEDSPADLHAGIEETVMLLAPRLRASGVELQRRFGELPLVICRAGEMNQVFMNLLVNALQALEGAPGASPPVITVETWVEEESAVVAVSDNGPGVPVGLETRIFDPFFTTKPRGQGTGLGLSISTDIARRHGGSLSLETSSAGARFVCRLPLGRRSPPSRPTPHQ